MRKVLIGIGIVLAIIAAAFAGGYAMLHRPDIPYAELDQKYGYPADETQLVDLGDGLIAHVRQVGPADRPAVVLIHGYTASSHTWDSLVDRLKTGYRLIAIDLPGHGLTRTPQGYRATIEGFADYVDAVMGKLGVARAVIVGSSMGGNTAWQLALRHPARVEALVLVGAAGWPTPPDASRADASNPTIALLSNPMVGPFFRDLDATSVFTQGLKASFVKEELATKAMIRRYTDLSRAPGHRPVILDLRLSHAQRTPATKEALSVIQAPTLILHGEKDALVPLDGGRKFDEAIPNSKLIAYPNVGHIPHEEIPDQVAADMKEFLATLFPEPPSGAPLVLAPR